jgi:hypothetical protein
VIWGHSSVAARRVSNFVTGVARSLGLLSNRAASLDIGRNAPGLPSPLQIEVAKFRRRIRFTVFGKVHDHNVRVALAKHLHCVS